MVGQGPENPMQWSVAEFLDRFKTALELCPPVWHEHARRLEEIADLGITRNQVLEELQNLEAVCQVKGPEADDAESAATSALHVFKHTLKGTSTIVYVKIAVKLHPKKKHVLIPKIWSFKRWS